MTGDVTGVECWTDRIWKRMVLPEVRVHLEDPGPFTALRSAYGLMDVRQAHYNPTSSFLPPQFMSSYCSVANECDAHRLKIYSRWGLILLRNQDS